jgi:hypothetical protein
VAENAHPAELSDQWARTPEARISTQYIIMGAAMFTWRTRSATVTDTVKNLAVTFFSLAVTGVGAALKGPAQHVQ